MMGDSLRGGGAIMEKTEILTGEGVGFSSKQLEGSLVHFLLSSFGIISLTFEILNLTQIRRNQK